MASPQPESLPQPKQKSQTQIQIVKADIDIGILFKFIKPFDGTREKLNSFITNCDNAMKLAAENQKQILFKFILSQLEGKAESTCSIKEFESWDQLNVFLNTQFGERKHYAHLLTDLQECRQMINEPVNKFALRVETCLSKLLTEITLSNKKKCELQGRISAMEDLALHTFLIGLKPEISNLVRSKSSANLNQAINTALSEEAIINLFNKRNLHSSSSSQRQAPLNRYIPKPSIPNQLPRPQIPRFNEQSTLFCRYCKYQGHTIEQCRKREFNNNRYRPNQLSQSQQRSNQDQFKPRPARINFVEDNNTYCYDEQPSTSYADTFADQQTSNETYLNE